MKQDVSETNKRKIYFAPSSIRFSESINEYYLSESMPASRLSGEERQQLSDLCGYPITGDMEVFTSVHLPINKDGIRTTMLKDEDVKYWIEVELQGNSVPKMDVYHLTESQIFAANLNHYTILYNGVPTVPSIRVDCSYEELKTMSDVINNCFDVFIPDKIVEKMEEASNSFVAEKTDATRSFSQENSIAKSSLKGKTTKKQIVNNNEVEI